MLVSLIVISLSCSMADADLSSLPDEAILEEATSAFRKGVEARGTSEEMKFFHQAYRLYEELHKRGAENSDLDLNQGNAALLAGRLGEAIFAYRRGLRLAPNQQDLRANLAYAREQVIYPSVDNFARPATSLWPSWLPRLTPGPLLAITFFFYTLSWLGIIRWAMIRQIRPLRGVAGAFAIAIAFAAAFAVQAKSVHDEENHPLVVIARDGTYLRKGNHSNYPKSYDTPLNQGVEARLLYVRGDWLQIQLAGGEVGWVPESAALVDSP